MLPSSIIEWAENIFALLGISKVFFLQNRNINCSPGKYFSLRIDDTSPSKVKLFCNFGINSTISMEHQHILSNVEAESWKCEIEVKNLTEMISHLQR